MENQELQHKLVEILCEIQADTATATDFSLQQLPDIAQSYVTYGRVQSTLDFVFPFLIAVFLAGLCVRAYNKYLKTRNEGEAKICIFSAFGSTFGFVLSVLNFDLLPFLAPKVWLLKEIARMAG